jgi:hypothetical protein
MVSDSILHDYDFLALRIHRGLQSGANERSMKEIYFLSKMSKVFMELILIDFKVK